MMRVLPIAILATAAVAWAQAPVDPPRPALALDEMQLLSASPDAPYAALGWRFGTRARLGVPVPILREPEGWRVRIDGAVELYNRDSPDFFPYQYWRGWLAVRVGHRWALSIEGRPAAIAATISIEHESDHESYHGFLYFTTFLYTDSASARGDFFVALGELNLLGALTARGHFLSCTDVHTSCTNYPSSFSGSFEIAFDLSARTGGLPFDDGSVRGCGAIHLGYLAHVLTVVEEARAALDIGACWRLRGAGEWQLLGEARAGSEIAIHRGQQRAELGIELRWVL